MESHVQAGWRSCSDHAIPSLARPTTPTQDDYPSLEGFSNHQQQLSLHDAPILNLNADVLVSIFLLNSDMFEADQPNRVYRMTSYAYDATRYSAQTCRLWRNVTLASSTLWANVVDLEGLRRANDEWREEFMKRTGNSLLSVKGSFDGALDVNFLPFFKSLLDNNWGRMRKFDVDITGYTLSLTQALSALWGKAEYLESFRLDPHEYYNLDTNSAPQTLFADNAPRLRHFRCNSERISYSLCAPCMKQLRSVSITYPFTAYQVLDALAQLPLLESIELRFQRVEVGSEPSASPRHIYLPHLREILIDCNLETIVAQFLHHQDVPCRLIAVVKNTTSQGWSSTTSWRSSGNLTWPPP